jgi:oligoendopeptidase F
MRALSDRPASSSSRNTVFALALERPGQERDRSDIPDHYKWNLADVYPSLDAWRAAKERIVAEVPALRRYEGRLASSPSALADALDLMFRLDKEIARADVYACLLADEDTRDSEHEAMRQQMIQVAAEFRATASYIEPEILRFEKGLVDAFLVAEPRLNMYDFHLRDIARRAAHTLTDREERLLASAMPLAESAESVYNIFANADFPYPEVTLSDGGTIIVNQANLMAFRASANRDDRRNVMSAFFEALGRFNRTYGTLMNGSVQKALFFAKARSYGSTLEGVLDNPNIPVEVYTRLVRGINEHLPTFHRYLALRRRMLSVDELHYYDLYAPPVAAPPMEYSTDEARRHILNAFAPLGSEYVSVVERAFNDRWIDLLPNRGKRSGAYSNGGAYDVHPYILMNYNGKYDDVATLAHELGHTMHSYYSNKVQPYVSSMYRTFVAEVASTFNESLLIDYLLRTIEDDEQRLSLLGSYLEGIKGTIFRQTQFAEFELRAHEMVQRGEPVTGDSLSALYMEITKKYYGHDAGVCIVDDFVAHEWSYIPHFYREFYVFQYATSFMASEALAQKVKRGDAQAVERYLRFLSSGGYGYPIDQLKDAGVDMTTDEPMTLTMLQMNKVMTEIETLLARHSAVA